MHITLTVIMVMTSTVMTKIKTTWMPDIVINSVLWCAGEADYGGSSD